jgi:enoyl-CoA hydratase/carnithine racemase
MSQHVRVTRDGDIAEIVINRPERRNALNAEIAQAVADAVAEAGASARVIILTGSRGSFCAGGDLDELAAWSEGPPEAIATTLYSSFQAMIRNIRAADAVVIAAVGGPAVGAGMDLALACDLRVASSDARFGQVWVRLGVIPGTGGAFLTPMLAGPTRAAELLLTGDLITAAQAAEAGLVNSVVAPDALMDEARSLAARILRHPREGVVANKRALVMSTEAGVSAALDHAREIQPGRFTSDEFKTAVKQALQR